MTSTISELIPDINKQFTSVLRYMDRNIDDADFIKKLERLYDDFQELNEMLIGEI